MILGIGIDPGKSGAIAIYNGDVNRFLHINRNTESPFEIKQNFEHAITDPMDEIHPERYFALIERGSSRPGEGVKSSFSSGESNGYLKMLLVCFEIKFDLVSPQSWMKQFAPNRPKFRAKDHPGITNSKAMKSIQSSTKSKRKRHIRDLVLSKVPSAKGLAVVDADACALALLAWEKANGR